MKVIKGIAKGKEVDFEINKVNERIKELETEVRTLKGIAMSFDMVIKGEYELGFLTWIEGKNMPFLLELERMFGLLTSFIPQSNTSQSLFTKQDQESIKNAKSKERKKIANSILHRIEKSDEARADKKTNKALWEKWDRFTPIEKVRFLIETLTLRKSEKKKSVIEKYRSHFMNPAKIKPSDSKEVVKLKPTPLETKLYNFCKKKRIDLTKSVREVHTQAEVRGFRNLKGKPKLHLSTVGKMLKKYRPQ